VLIVIQDCKTHLYLTSYGVWSDQLANAKPFRTGDLAISFCIDQEISMAQIVLKFDKEEHDIRFPVSKGCHDL
jgi:hypothetical protein